MKLIFMLIGTVCPGCPFCVSTTTTAEITTTTKIPCPLLPCAFPKNCESYIIGNFTLEDGTVCPGCPICTQWANSILQ